MSSPNKGLRTLQLPCNCRTRADFATFCLPFALSRSRASSEVLIRGLSQQQLATTCRPPPIAKAQNTHPGSCLHKSHKMDPFPFSPRWSKGLHESWVSDEIPIRRLIGKCEVCRGTCWREDFLAINFFFLPCLPLPRWLALDELKSEYFSISF